MSTQDVDQRKPVLCVGLVCLDLVTVVERYPKEDTDMRSSTQYKVRGGNANNSCTVLAELGFQTMFLGSLAGQGDPDTEFVLKGMKGDGVKVADSCPRNSGSICPNSVVLSSQSSGSRTIIHTNLGLPELCLDDLMKITLDKIGWIHLEGRNRVNLLNMLKYLGTQDKVKVSVEVEKVGRHFEDFIPLADVVFISKDVAQHHGCTNKEEAVLFFQPRLRKGASLVIPWGESGASAWSPDQESVISIPAFPPPGGVLDTLGAGDTFNAVVIGCLSVGCELEESVRTGCLVAGIKVGRVGFHGLKQEALSVLPDLISVFH